MRKPAVFFDRDGVITKLIEPNLNRGPRALSELEVCPESHEVISKLQNLGFHCEIISNQPDIARGLLPKAVHFQICHELSTALPKGIRQRYCLHDNNDDCDCRKPRTKMVEDAIIENNLDRAAIFFIGDKWTDILTAKNAGIKSVLLRNKYSWDSTSHGTPPVGLVPDLEIQELSHIVGIVTNFHEKPSH